MQECPKVAGVVIDDQRCHRNGADHRRSRVGGGRARLEGVAKAPELHATVGEIYTCRKHAILDARMSLNIIEFNFQARHLHRCG